MSVVAARDDRKALDPSRRYAAPLLFHPLTPGLAPLAHMQSRRCAALPKGCCITARAGCGTLVSRQWYHYEAAEETVVVPARALWIVRNLQRQGLHNVLELAGRGEIDWLVHVIRGRMKALREPLLVRGSLW